MNAERLLEHYERIADAPDAIRQLRRFVLDLAVRGKLVPQDVDDEPASDLLNRIAEARTRLVASGAIRQAKAQSPVMAAAAFDIPPTWVWAPIGNIFLYDAGLKREPKTLKSALWLLELEDVEKDTGSLALRVRSSERESQSTKSEFQVGDILYGKLRPYLNKVLVADEPGYSTTEIVALRPYSPLCSGYCALALRRPDFVDYVTRLGQGTKMPRLRTEDAVVAPFPLPPLAEQHRIVSKVDELMALCDQLEASRGAREAARDRLATASLARLNTPDPDTFADDTRFALDALPALTTRPDQIKQLRQTILNLAVRGKLVAQEDADEDALQWLLRVFPDVPEGRKKSMKTPARPLENIEADYTLPASWKWMALGNLVSVMDAGWSPECENHPRKDAATWGVLKTTAVQTLAFDCQQHKELPSRLQARPQYEAKVGDILVTRAGPKNRVGISCAVDRTEPKLMISDKLIRLRLVEGLNPRFFALTLNAGISSDAIEAAKSGMAVMQMNISQDKLRAVPVPLPPLAEQHRIVAKVDELMALCDQLEASLDATNDTRRRLLDALLAEALAPVAVREMEAA